MDSDSNCKMESKISKESCHSELLSLMCDTIPEKYLLKAKKELNETKENTEKGLKMLRESIEKENLNLSTDTDFLLLFLRQAKFDFAKAEEKLKKYTKFHSVFKNLLASSDLTRVQAVVDHRFAGVLPFRDRKGRAVIYAQASTWNKELFDLNDAAVAIISLFMFCSSFPLSSICGIAYLGDAKVNDLYDLLPMANSYKQFVPYLNSVPYRIKRVDVMNTNLLCRCCYAAIRPFLPMKMRNRMFLHGGDYEILEETYPSSMLPTFYGGTLESLSCSLYKDKFLDFFKNLKSEVEKTT